MSEFVSSVIESGNTRIASVRKFLAKPPKRAAFLRLVAAGEEAEAQIPLGEWQEGEIVPELAGEIVELLNSHASEMQAHITASLAFVDENGKVVRATVLKRQGNHVAGDGTSIDTPESINSQLTGDVRAQSIQAQRHNEIMFRVYMTGMASVLTHSERIVSRQTEMLETLASRLGRAERRVDAREEELAELLQAITEAKDGGQQSPALDKALAMLERLAPMLVAQFQQANTQRPPSGGE